MSLKTDCGVDMEVTDGMVHEACSRLRFSEGLRRRWREARAEAAIQEAVGISFVEGVRVRAADLRSMFRRLTPSITLMFVKRKH